MKNKITASGFTLIELLVVIAIIGILASVVIVSLVSARQKSRDARRLADIKQLMTALELFYADNSRYPLPTAASDTGPTAADGAVGYTWASYDQFWQLAPTPPDGGCAAVDNTYTYAQTSSGRAYTLTFCLGAITGGYAAGVHTAIPGAIQ